MKRIFLLEEDDKSLNKGVEIATTDKDLDIYDNLHIGGRYYNVILKNEEGNIVGVTNYSKQNWEEMNEPKFYCPHCGYTYHEADKWGESGEVECSYCGAGLKFTKEVEVSYNVELIKTPKLIKIK